jgi:pimeloyl-ACP methyl ester carboxylesterase
MKKSRFVVAMFVALGFAGIIAPRAALAVDVAYQFRTVESADGVPLNVVTAGDPTHPAILLVHGIGQSYLAFENQLSSSLRQKYYLVAFDLRGHGNSGKPWRPEAYSDRATWAGDVNSVIRALGLRRPVILGWSYGTLVVLDYMRLHGTRNIAGIVMTGAYGGLTTPNAKAAPPAPEFLQLRADLAGPDLDRKWIASRAMAKYLTAKPMSEAWMERATALGLLLPPAARTGMFAQPFDNTDLLAGLQTLPMLFVMGAKDAGSPVALGRQLVASLGRARILIYPEDGHSPFIESPEQFNRELSEFVDSLAPTQASDGRN